MRYILFALLCSSLLLLAACKSGNRSRASAETQLALRNDGTLDFVRSDGSVIKTITIEIAETPAARSQGLMNRRQLTLNQGMLFLFPAPKSQSFWMRNTPLPLDIIFVAADSQIVNIAKRTRPLSDERINSTGPAQFVVEVRGGFSDRYGLTEEDRIRWQRNE